LRRRLCLLLLGLAVSAAAQEATLEQRLAASLEGNVIFLRGFYTPPLLRYDHQGELYNPAPTGSWTADGAVQVDAVLLHDDRLELRGHRMAVALDAGLKQLRYLNRGDRVMLEVARLPGAGNEQMEMALRRVLVQGVEELAQLVPPHWQTYFRHYPDDLPWAAPRRRYEPGAEPRLVTRAETRPRPARPEPEPLPDGTPVTPLRGLVRPPVAVFTPDPEFPAVARRRNLDATLLLMATIDLEGRPRNIRVEEAFGFGLEEAAVAAVERWRYRPGTLDGRPVAVEVGIRLYFRDRNTP
jgi:TonB family protein